MDILVVEDDVLVADLLRRVFQEEGHAPTICCDLRSAREALASRSFDFVILDWMLPDGEGIDVCPELRARRPPIPLIVLTSRRDEPDRVRGLRAGADDYLAKPFGVSELLARIEAVHRRVGEPLMTRVGALSIDRRQQQVTAHGRRLDLRAREYALLARLADTPDADVSRSALLLDVWSTALDPGTGVIDVQIKRLREKLGDLAWMVETVRGQGYRLRTAP